MCARVIPEFVAPQTLQKVWVEIMQYKLGHHPPSFVVTILPLAIRYSPVIWARHTSRIPRSAARGI
jgi:hypothetical protein